MTCSDCHATDSAASKGPHGSAVKWMLTGTNKAWPYTTAAGNGGSTGTYRPYYQMTTGNGSNDGLFCLNCHPTVNTNVMHMAINSWTATNHRSFNVTCVNCHIRVPHGGKVARLLTTNTAGLPARYKSNGNNTMDTTGGRTYWISSWRMPFANGSGFTCSSGTHLGANVSW
jgi:hypothetical protein